MLHGAFAGPWCFDELGQAFRDQGWRVEAPALRHHSPPYDAVDRDALAATGLADYTADLTDYLQGFDEPPVLLGHSLGGLLAQLLAGRGLSRAVIAMTPAAPWGILPASEDEIAAAQGLMAAGPFWRMALDAVFEIARANSLNCLPEKQQRQTFERFGPESGRALFESMFWMFDKDRASHVNAIDVAVPLLCLAGGRDKVISPATVRNIAAKYPELATYIEFQDMGHMMPLEPGWPEVAETCLEWLAVIPPDG